jgi:hypothetical protein
MTHLANMSSLQASSQPSLGEKDRVGGWTWPYQITCGSSFPLSLKNSHKEHKLFMLATWEQHFHGTNLRIYEEERKNRDLECQIPAVIKYLVSDLPSHHQKRSVKTKQLLGDTRQVPFLRVEIYVSSLIFETLFSSLSTGK